VCAVIESKWRVSTVTIDGNRSLDTISDEISGFCRRVLEGKGSDDVTSH